MNIYKNLVSIHTQAISPSLCQRTIDYFDNHIEESKQSAIANPDFIDPLDFRRSQEICLQWPQKKGDDTLCFDLANAIVPLMDEYFKKYSQFLPKRPTQYEQIHLLKYEANDGWYHFHSDNDGTPESNIDNRVISVIIYLNDVKEGGETEFEYIDVGPIKPNQGDVIMFPSGKSHCHRGNIPISGQKYIAVLWLKEERA